MQQAVRPNTGRNSVSNSFSPPGSRFAYLAGPRHWIHSLYISGEHEQYGDKPNNPKRRHSLKSFTATQLTRGILLTLLLSVPAFAQYPGGGGSATPTYGSGKAIAVGAAAAAGAGVLYLTLHHRGSLTGCVQSGDDGLSLVDDKKHQTYSLLPGSTDLKSGERVELRGKRSKDGKGIQTFQVSKVVKTLGACSTQSAVSSLYSR
jgi:hypothetical protein